MNLFGILELAFLVVGCAIIVLTIILSMVIVRLITGKEV